MKKRETLTTKKMSNLLIGLLLMTVINVFTDQGSIVAQTIDNPGFETGDLTGWVLGNADKTEINEEFVSEGTYSCMIKGPQWIKTTVTGLTENTTYDASIMHRLDNLGGNDRTQSLFYIDDNSDPVIVVTQIGDTVYQQLSYRFTTAAGQTSIEIGVQNDGFFWGYFDDLIVTEAGTTEEYSLTITAENGSVTSDPDQVTYGSGTIVSLTATAAEGFEFTGWSGDATGTDNPLLVTMDADKSITATFDVLPSIDVTGVSLDQETASVEVSNTLQLAATVAPADATDPSVTWSTGDAAIATVDENGLVTGVSEGVTSITVTTNDQGLAASCVITVTAAPTSILTITIVGNGSVTVDGNEYTEPVTVSLDQVVSISATADDGNEFTEWSGDESGTDNPFSITMDADKSITATFDVVQSINHLSNKAVIFPNPVENSLYIESKSAIQKITLVNSIGEKVESFNLTGEYSVNLPVSNLKSGLYILILEDITGHESFEKVFKK